MSWDASLIRFAKAYTSGDELRQDNPRPLPLGPRAEVEAAINETFPGTAWEAPADWGIWASWDSSDGSIKFSTGDEDPVDRVTLHVRAADTVMTGILDLADRLHCQVLDHSSGEFVSADDHDPAQGLRAWRQYRDRVVGQAPVPAWADPVPWQRLAAELWSSAPAGTLKTRMQGTVARAGCGGRSPGDTDTQGRSRQRTSHFSLGNLEMIAQHLGEEELYFDATVESGSATIAVLPLTPALVVGPAGGIDEILRQDDALPAPFRQAPAVALAGPSAGADPGAVSRFVRRLLPDAAPASDEAIDAAEARCGFALSDEARAFYRAAAAGDLVETDADATAASSRTVMRITSLDSSSRRFPGRPSIQWSYAAEEVYIDPQGRVQDLGYSPAWLEIGDDQGGNLWVVDLAPGPHGNLGQVLFIDHETNGGASWVAPSLAEFFELENKYPLVLAGDDWAEEGPARDYRLRIGGISPDRTLAKLTPKTQVLIVNADGPTDLAPITGHQALRAVSITGQVTSLAVLSTLPALEWLELSLADWKTLLDADKVPTTLLAAGFTDAWPIDESQPVISRLRALWGLQPFPVTTIEMYGSTATVRHPDGPAAWVSHYSIDPVAPATKADTDSTTSRPFMIGEPGWEKIITDAGGFVYHFWRGVKLGIWGILLGTIGLLASFGTATGMLLSTDRPGAGEWTVFGAGLATLAIAAGMIAVMLRDKRKAESVKKSAGELIIVDRDSIFLWKADDQPA